MRRSHCLSVGRFVAILVVAVQLNGEGTQKSVMTPVQDEATTDSASGLSDVVVTVETDSVQDAAGRIPFRVRIQNKGNKVLELFDPADSTQPQLFDSRGMPVHLGQQIPNALINTREPNGERRRPKRIRIMPSADYSFQAQVKRLGMAEGTSARISRGAYRLKVVLTLISASAGSSERQRNVTLASDLLPIQLK